jgi:hypothetical protein
VRRSRFTYDIAPSEPDASFSCWESIYPRDTGVYAPESKSDSLERFVGSGVAYLPAEG